MKLTNHTKNNWYEVDTYIMKGTILMTETEWKKARNYLMVRQGLAKKAFNTYIRDSINVDKLMKTNSRLFSLGVCANQLLAEYYKLRGYKNQNYAIQIEGGCMAQVGERLCNAQTVRNEYCNRHARMFA